MKVDKTLISGSTAMLLLKLLSEKDMYGYEMIETLRNRSQNVFELKAGTLYPPLKKKFLPKCVNTTALQRKEENSWRKRQKSGMRTQMRSQRF